MGIANVRQSRNARMGSTMGAGVKGLIGLE